MIFGVLNSKFTSGSNEVDLQNSTLNPSFLVQDVLETKGILTGDVYYNTLGDYAEFSVNTNLFKYDNPSEKLIEILAYRNSEVSFYPHKDNDAIKDINGDEVKFKIIEVTPFYLTQIDIYEVVRTTFKSTIPVSLFAVTSSGYGTLYGQNYGIGL